MQRLIMAAAAAASLAGGLLVSAPAPTTAYVCAQFQDPTVNYVWTTVCYLPCRSHGCS